MDSRLAADPVARHILELLATLEKAAGVRAHYRILDPPPLTSTELPALQVVSRVLGDWIGLRNAMFDLTIINDGQPPRLVRTDPGNEHFAMEVPVSALATPTTALAFITRQIARTYLIISNIAGGSVEPDRTAGSMADVTAVFLGMGKLVLNSPATGHVPLPTNVPLTIENQPLSPDYLAFTHRLVCSMRGLDWNQHTSGMNTQAQILLRGWDSYRDSVFSQALRNVLTASASHRPLMDAVEDNHLALARFDQIQRAFTATVLEPLHLEMERYHLTCKEGMERLNAREQDTYDPCLLYLNQLRRRMDLQRYADMLLVQQDHIIERLRVLTTGLSDLAARELVNVEHSGHAMDNVQCPFDGTPISLYDGNKDSRVKCPTCGYAFVATSGLPQISALRRTPLPPDTSADNVEEQSSGADSNPTAQTAASSSAVKNDGITAIKSKKSNSSATLLIMGIIIMPLSWLPMLGYTIYMILQGLDTPLAPLLGKAGIWGSFLGLSLVAMGLIGLVIRWFSGRSNRPATAPPAR